MKAIVTRGKYKNVMEDVMQWCNDWFMLRTINKPLSPSSLLFTQEDIEKIVRHGNNGMLLSWYEPKRANDAILVGDKVYCFTFRKRK